MRGIKDDIYTIASLEYVVCVTPPLREGPHNRSISTLLQETADTVRGALGSISNPSLSRLVILL